MGITKADLEKSKEYFTRRLFTDDIIPSSTTGFWNALFTILESMAEREIAAQKNE